MSTVPSYMLTCAVMLGIVIFVFAIEMVWRGLSGGFKGYDWFDDKED